MQILSDFFLSRLFVITIGHWAINFNVSQFDNPWANCVTMASIELSVTVSTPGVHHSTNELVISVFLRNFLAGRIVFRVKTLFKFVRPIRTGHALCFDESLDKFLKKQPVETRPILATNSAFERSN